jgi:hypothetical protein
MRLRVAAVTAMMAMMAIMACAAPAFGQTREPRFEISAGALYIGGNDLGGRSADLVQNERGGGAYPVFESDNRVDAAPAFEARFGWRFGTRLTVEGGAFMSRPQLTARLTSDVENAPDATIVEDLSLYIFDAAAIVAFGRPEWRVTPFVRAGAGYVRQLHEDNVLVETGQAYHAGGGVTAWFGRGYRRMGLRLDARVYVLQGDVDLGASDRTVPAGGAAFVFAF